MFLNASTGKGLYEVPGQQWADMTATDNTYGVSILNDCKYGWNKPADNTLNLTLLHSPSPGNNYGGDQSSDVNVGIHSISYSLYSHSGTWTNGTIAQGERLNQPVFAFQSTPRAGRLGKTVSLVRTSTPQVAVMAIKKAEKSSNYIVRVRETTGNPITGAKLIFPSTTITAASEVNGLEEAKGAAQFSGSELTFDLAKYQPKTFSIKLGNVVGIGGKFDDLLRAVPSNRVISVSLASARAAHAELRIPRGETVDAIAILDARGRMVRTLVKGGDAAPAESLVWDGRNGAGRIVGPGVYFVSCLTDQGRIAARLTKTE
jgi:hypothetical protein